MKKHRETALIAITLTVLTALLTGCGSKPTMAEEAQARYELMAASVGLDEQETQQLASLVCARNYNAAARLILTQVDPTYTKSDVEQTARTLGALALATCTS